jgi:outer membrane receptor for ferrienterochelin and colicin
MGHRNFKSALRGHSAFRSAALVAVLACSAPVMAQDADETDADADMIVVTGSRILRPNGDSPVPITTATVEELTNNGRTSIGDVLNDLPSLRTSFGQGTKHQLAGHHRP